MGEVHGWSVTDDSNVDLFPENMPFGDVNDAGRAVQGAVARWFKDVNGSLASSGSSNAFTATSNRTIASLVDGTRLSFKANHSITGAATFNLNGLGAKDIKRFNGSALSSGDIISGQIVDVVYSSSLDDWIMVSALAALVGSTHADFGENAAPGDPAANTGRLYAKDDGAGTTVVAYRDSAGVESIIGGVASEAQALAGSSNIKAVSPGRQHLHPAMPKARGRGAAAGGTVGTPYNIASIARNSTGIYTVTLTNPMADTNYEVIATVNHTASYDGFVEIVILTESTFQAMVFDSANGRDDRDFAVVVFGTLA